MVLLRAFFTVCEASVTEISDSKVRGYENKRDARVCCFGCFKSRQPCELRFPQREPYRPWFLHFLRFMPTAHG